MSDKPCTKWFCVETAKALDVAVEFTKEFQALSSQAINKAEELQEQLEQANQRIAELEATEANRGYSNPIPRTVTVRGYTSGQLSQPACLWDSMSEEDRKKSMGLACPCPKCSPHY